MKKFWRKLAFLLVFVSVAFASTQGPNSGTTAGGSWTNPTNAQTTNAIYATCLANNSNCVGPLSGSTYGFSIPAGATINGITVAIVAHCSTANTCDLTNTTGGTGVCVTKVAATCTGTAKLDATLWPAGDTTFTEGGGADLWGTTWTVSEINATGFGSVIDPEVNVALNKTMSVDSILITVTYTPAAGCKSCFMPLLQSKQTPSFQIRTLVIKKARAA